LERQPKLFGGVSALGTTLTCSAVQQLSLLLDPLQTRWPGFTITSWQHRPQSKGWVRARSADPFDRPIIQPNYLTEDGDRRVTIAAMRLARQLINSRAMQRYVVSEDYPGPEVQTDDEMLEAARKWGNSTFHVMGTCRMGPASDPTAVVDDHLRVRGMPATTAGRLRGCYFGARGSRRLRALSCTMPRCRLR
jgi:choline dehydrogenase-like flavoprotein